MRAGEKIPFWPWTAFPGQTFCGGNAKVTQFFGNCRINLNQSTTGRNIFAAEVTQLDLSSFLSGRHRLLPIYSNHIGPFASDRIVELK
jgi:hypothetical protein